MDRHIEATLNRPKGERILDTGLARVNIQERIEQLKEENAWAKNDRNSITIFKTDRISIVLIAMHKGATINPHISEGVMCLQMLSGKIKFATNQAAVELKKEEFVIIHKGIEHDIEALEENIFLLTIANI